MITTEEVTQMLESYVHCIEAEGHPERWHYIPAVQEVIELLNTAQPAGVPLVDVGSLGFRGNTVSYIYDRKDAYAKAIDRAFKALADAGVKADGKTELCDLIARALESSGKRYQWLANRVLACDYGDNDTPGQIGWRVRYDLLANNGERQPAFMFGQSIDRAIDAEIAKTTGSPA